ncbi:aminotransferase class V-fold PLP-dependent enzyme [Candidatus Micrarchaeota archaeon]|nr:aminotransferase class V-fold PLP-dependent enzyme [Candidatus Micrarchaeota archaeon]
MLLTPGPVPVLDEILEAQCGEMITHRSRECSELYGDLVERTKAYFNCDEAYVITGSGALGIETLVLNLCDKNSRTICFPNGDFGEKQVLTVKAHSNADVHHIEGGKGWGLDRTKQAIDESDAPVLAMVYNETSYGIKNDIRHICRYAKSKGMLTLIDGVSAWPGTGMDMKAFGVDGFAVGSQKAIGAPPGMALIGLSRDAAERYSSRDDIPGYYCDLRRHKKRYEKDRQTPNTPAITLFWALQKAFDVLDKKGGAEACVRRHAEAAEHTRKRLAGMGFGLIAEKGFESNTVTGFYCEKPGQAKEIRSRLLEDYNIRIVGSRGAFKENGLRIAHMGNFSIEDIDTALDAIEKIIK